MRKTWSFVVALAVLVPAAAQAQWSVGARTGYAIAMGDAGGTLKMSDLTNGQIPIQLDVGYRIPDTALTVGGYLSYGFGSVAGEAKTSCDLDGASCSSSSLRLGAQLLYTFADAKQQNAPWVGVGFGYDKLTLKESGFADTNLTGFEFLILQAGYDWRFGTGSFGAFAGFSLAQYSKLEVPGFGSATITDKKMHEWFTIGIRGAFGFGS